MNDQENIPPEMTAQQTTPGKVAEAREALRDCQRTVPEAPSPDQPCDPSYVKKELGNCVENGARKRHSRLMGNARNLDQRRGQNGSCLIMSGDTGSRSGSAYSQICSSAALHFARILEFLVERSDEINFEF